MRIEEEAEAMQDELQNNCERNKPDWGSAAEGLGIEGCVDADVMRGIRAEFEDNESKTVEKYVGQRLCVRGKITNITEGTMQGNASVLVYKERLFNTTFPIRYGIRNGEREAWAKPIRKGKVIEAECTVRDVSDLDILSFEDCELIGE